MRVKRNSLIALCAGLVFTQACWSGFTSTSDIVLVHDVSPQPPRVGPITITLKLTNTSGKPLAGAHLALEGNMSHAGMAPVSATAKEIAPGSYQSIMDLSMAGDWTVLVHITFLNGWKAEQQFEIKGVAPA